MQIGRIIILFYADIYDMHMIFIAQLTKNSSNMFSRHRFKPDDAPLAPTCLQMSSAGLFVYIGPSPAPLARGHLRGIL